MIRITKLDKHSLNKLERELDRVADKHGIEEPLRFVPTLDDVFESEDEDEEDEF